MRKKIIIAVLALLPLAAFSQKTDTLIKKLDSLNKQDTVGRQLNDINKTAYNKGTKINFKSYFILLGSDLKQEITAPFHIRRKDLIPLGAYLVMQGALFLTDEPVQRFALDLRDHNAGVRNVSKHITRFGASYEAYVLGGLAAYGFIFKNEKIQTTTLLSTQAYLTGWAMESLLKMLSGRQRPYYYDPNHLEAEPTFHGPFGSRGRDINGKRLNSSFPSGHTTVAFAVATVFAKEYKDRPLVPIIAYTASTMVGLSRITENKHWVSDVFAGAVLGFFTGKQVVNNYHRYAKLKEPEQNKGSVSFGIRADFGRPMPSLIYTFR